MNQDNGAAAPPNAQPAGDSGAAGSEQATPQDVSQETLPEVESPPLAAGETGEAQKPAPEDDQKPKPLSRSKRQALKIQRLSTLIAEQQARIEDLQKRAESAVPPKEADYNGDWQAWQTDLTAFKAAQQVSNRLDEHAKRDAEQRIADARREAAEEFLARSDEVREQIADFDEVFTRYAQSGGTFAPHVIEELHDSEKGPLLAYFLAQNPQTAFALNQMSPREAAREVGRIEARLAIPATRKQTQAPPPVAPPKGGAVASKSLNDLAKSDDVSAYAKARLEQMAKSARQ